MFHEEVAMSSMKNLCVTLFGMAMAMCLVATDAVGDEPNGSVACQAVGDGVADDTDAIQKMLDGGAGTVHLPAPSRYYLISRPLVIHSNQTLQVDRFATIRLKPQSNCPMLTNADKAIGDENIAVIGGIWDMDNLHQSLTEYQKHRRYTAEPYDASRYLGVLMRFNRVKNLTLRGLTLKDPVTYGVHLGNLRQFTVEDITFDYNLKLKNMDGVHINGNSRFGRVANLKGATNDDQLALNADDCGYFEMSRGPIEDVSVDGIFAENGYTAVRLLSAGSPVRRIRLANIFGTFRNNVVSFTNHNAHAGSSSTFEDISITGVFCGKPGTLVNLSKPLHTNVSPIWIASPAVVNQLTIRDYHRTENAVANDDIRIEPGATVQSLTLADVSSVNRTSHGAALLNNNGTIDVLHLSNVTVASEGGVQRGHLLVNAGVIRHKNSVNVQTSNLEALEKPAARP
jgi:hypothetical protein